LDQDRLRGARRKFEADHIDVGNEPPLSVDGGTGVLVDRRRLSIQWFSGTILTGLFGAALMSGAVFASLDGETNFAAAPEHIEMAPRTGGDRSGIHKTDRLPGLTEQSVTHQILRIATTMHVRDRELVHTRPYARVSGNLSLTVSDLSANIPPFNPQQLMAEGVAADEAPPAAEPDAEVSFVTCDFVPPTAKGKVTPAVCDLNSLLPKVKASTLLPLDEVMSRVREVASTRRNNSLIGDADPTAAAGLKLSYAAEGDADPYVGFEARVIPQNITLRPKAFAATDWSEHTIVAKRGETVGSILHELGALPDEIRAIAAVIGAPARDGGLKEGHKVRVLTAAAGLGHMEPLRVLIASDSAVEAGAALSDHGTYVPVDIRNVDADIGDTQVEENTDDDDGSGVRLYQSMYETALRNNIPPAVIEEMVRIYAYDVDFQRRVAPGDSFDVLYADDENGDGHSEVRYASLTIGGETKRYYRYQTADDGTFDYYDETGKSAKKFLVRKPVANGIMRSGFGERSHPLLHYMKMHTGVDWAAPTGTPIYAAGNGNIDEIGLKGGYGKYIRIRHANGYQTAYGHMTAFARGLEEGSRVRQGQVIGFVGSTGLSTGSHVRVLDGTALAAFERDRSDLDSMLLRVPAHIAQAR
jgi:murein DD-endopeptidase MepM/ murein hydrolase activator NlpD